MTGDGGPQRLQPAHQTDLREGKRQTFTGQGGRAVRDLEVQMGVVDGAENNPPSFYLAPLRGGALLLAGVEILRPDKAPFAEKVAPMLEAYRDEPEIFELIRRIQAAGPEDG